MEPGGEIEMVGGVWFQTRKNNDRFGRLGYVYWWNVIRNVPTGVPPWNSPTLLVCLQD